MRGIIFQRQVVVKVCEPEEGAVSERFGSDSQTIYSAQVSFMRARV